MVGVIDPPVPDAPDDADVDPMEVVVVVDEVEDVVVEEVVVEVLEDGVDEVLELVVELGGDSPEKRMVAVPRFPD